MRRLLVAGALVALLAGCGATGPSGGRQEPAPFCGPKSVYRVGGGSLSSGRYSCRLREGKEPVSRSRAQCQPGWIKNLTSGTVGAARSFRCTKPPTTTGRPSNR